MTASLDLTALRAANAARQAEWDKDDRIGLAYRGNELAGEVGEALENAVDVILMAAAAGRASNVAKKIERERLGIRGSRATIADLAAELADVVICVDLIAMGMGIDLAAAVVGKFNATSAKVGLATRLPAATHRTRMSDSSLYDEICMDCGATDYGGGLDGPCPGPGAAR